jgi:hypothetical protein
MFPPWTGDNDECAWDSIGGSGDDENKDESGDGVTKFVPFLLLLSLSFSVMWDDHRPFE